MTSFTGAVTEQELRNHFYQFGEIRQITMAPKQSCAFVQFTRRGAAELAAEKSFNKVVIKGRKLTIRYAHFKTTIIYNLSDRGGN